LHTLDAKETVNRIISTFPTNEQNRIRLTLGGVLRGVISQRLIQTVDNKRIAALEVLVRTPRIEQLIKENRDDEIVDTMAEGKDIYGSQTFDQAILDLYKVGKITQEKAFENATSAADLKLKMEGLDDKIIVGASSNQVNMRKEYREDEIFGLKE
jgi:twitching motility protein PilT